MNLPNPQNYTDGVLFFHDSHKVVHAACSKLEELLADAEARGVFQSFATRTEWTEVFDFFQRLAPIHERDEDEFLFPIVAAKVPHMGFQQPDSTIRFLTEGHDVLMKRIIPLVKDWEVFLNIPHDADSIESRHATHEKEDADFIANGRELVKLYREHASIEDTRVYNVADKVLTGEEKLELADRLRDAYSDERISGIYTYDEPRFSDPSYQVIYNEPTEAVSDQSVELEEEDEDE